MQEVLYSNARGRSLLRHIQARIEQCRQLKTEAVTQEEQEGWQAEESGLVDAFFGLDRTAIQRDRHPSHLPRYAAGLEDGQTIMKMLEPRSSPRRDEGRERTTPEPGSRSSDGNASPDTSLHRRQVT